MCMYEYVNQKLHICTFTQLFREPVLCLSNIISVFKTISKPQPYVYKQSSLNLFGDNTTLLEV